MEKVRRRTEDEIRNLNRKLKKIHELEHNVSENPRFSSGFNAGYNLSLCMDCPHVTPQDRRSFMVDNALSCRIYERETAQSGMVCYKTRSCLHCEDAQCIKACPAEALVKDSNGFVIPLRDKCIGCRACAKACPHDIPRFDEEGKLVKCDGCAVRVACGLEPACVRACNTGCLKLVP